MKKRQLVYTNRFQKDVKLCQKQNKDLNKLATVLKILISGDTIPARYKDHPLKGNWAGYRDLHIEPDWVLIYKETEPEIVLLAATGSHSKLLKK